MFAIKEHSSKKNVFKIFASYKEWDYRKMLWILKLLLSRMLPQLLSSACQKNRCKDKKIRKHKGKTAQKHNTSY